MSGYGHSQYGRPAVCVECSETKPIRGNGMCPKCYQRVWNRTRRHVPKVPREQRVRSEGQHRLYPQALVRGLPKGWGSIG